MQRVIELLTRDGIIDQNKLDLFINKYGEERVNIENLIKVKIINTLDMDEALIKELRMHTIEMNELEGIQGIDTTRILKQTAKNLDIRYVDINDIDIDYK
ncbi:MAG: hypothetical protein KAG56_05395, partial [Sulfurovaceae bacterium]|nr:hypothetical protein [Sulfurovaceae bacterium]